mgnify:CR=1 FL=1
MHVRSSLTNVATATKSEHEEPRKTGELRKRSRIERLLDAAMRVGSAVARVAASPRSTRARNASRTRRDPRAFVEDHEVALGGDDELALRDEPRVLARRPGPARAGRAAVHDEHRAGPTGEDPAQRPLIGVVEVPRVRDAQDGVVEPAEVRRQLAQTPETGELQRRAARDSCS